MRFSLISAAFVAAIVGYGSTVALVLAAAQALDATPEQTISWLLAVSLAKAIGSAFLSWRHRLPMVLAWSTAGAALLAATTNTTMPQAVGAFLVAAALILLTSCFRPLSRAISQIPDSIAAAMLAGILLPFCLNGIFATTTAPLLTLPMIAAFAVVRLFNPAMAVIAALITGAVCAFGLIGQPLPNLNLALPQLVFIAPEFDLGVMLGLGVPLYLVTMASQNLPGFAIMRAMHYEPPVGNALAVTGGLSMVFGLFGSHTINMAAISAAICLNPEVHPDPKERWKVALPYCGIWIILGLATPMLVTLIATLPPQYIACLVAVALLGSFTSAATTAFMPETTRFSATVTLCTTASGVVFFGIGAALWGLLAGLAFHILEQLAQRYRA